MVSAAIASSPTVTPIDGKEVYISIIVPIYNEVGNIRIIVPRLISALQIMPHRFEIIAVNDGSQDESSQELMEQAENHPELKIIDFRRNYGQTAAIMAGIDHAIGDVIVTIDADLQNDPDDIGILLAALERGYDVVSGWRRKRKDNSIQRNLPSNIANFLISWISGVKLHDYGCTLKAYRAETLKGIRLYGARCTVSFQYMRAGWVHA